jgi:succinyl-CoA synthetase beta subunit
MDQLGDIEQKLVVRLDGTHADEGRAMLTDANHPNVVAAATMAEAAERAVAFATEA